MHSGKTTDNSGFRFNLQELGGALGDLGTLLPLMIGLIMLNGLNPTSVLVGAGVLYIASGLYYGIPVPVQPLKAVAAIAITAGLSASVIGAAGLLMGIILLVLSLTKAISAISKLFPWEVIRGIQLAIGLTLFRSGAELALSQRMFLSGSPTAGAFTSFPVSVIIPLAAFLTFVLFQFLHARNRHYSPSLAVLGLGLGAGIIFGPVSSLARLSPVLPTIALPSAPDLWLAFTALVIPQLPLTMGNAVVATCDTATSYFGQRAQRVTPRALATSMGLANIVAGLAGGMPMCHGSGGMTAHYRLGARTGGANLMVGGLLLTFGVFGFAALPYLSLIPVPVLGVLLSIVGIYHASLIGDLSGWRPLSVASVVAIATVAFANVAIGFAAGILLYHIFRLVKPKEKQGRQNAPTP